MSKESQIRNVRHAIVSEIERQTGGSCVLFSNPVRDAGYHPLNIDALAEAALDAIVDKRG